MGSLKGLIGKHQHKNSAHYMSVISKSWTDYLPRFIQAILLLK